MQTLKQGELMGRITLYTQKEIKKLKGLYKKYKEEKSYTLKDIASDLKRSEWSVRDWLRKLFGDKYTEVSSKKLVRSIEKVSDKELKILFQKYKMSGVIFV